LANELVLKAVLAFSGCNNAECKRFGHNLTALYDAAKLHFNEDELVKLVWDNTRDLGTPSEIVKRSQDVDEETISLRWRYYPAQLALLNEMYDRPFITRYPKAGAFSVPEARVLLIGADAVRHVYDGWRA